MQGLPWVLTALCFLGTKCGTGARGLIRQTENLRPVCCGTKMQLKAPWSSRSWGFFFSLKILLLVHFLPWPEKYEYTNNAEISPSFILSPVERRRNHKLAIASLWFLWDSTLQGSIINDRPNIIPRQNKTPPLRAADKPYSSISDSWGFFFSSTIFCSYISGSRSRDCVTLRDRHGLKNPTTQSSGGGIDIWRSSESDSFP